MILIAVESRTMRMELERICATGRFSTLSASTLKEAREILALQTPAVVIVDEWFPDGSGADLIAEIRGSAVSGKAPPKILSIASGTSVASAMDDAATARMLPDVRLQKSDLAERLVQQLQAMLTPRATLTPQASLTPRARVTPLGAVLVIDDSLTYRMQLRQSLEAAGYSVFLAETGEEGLRMALEQTPDAILVDSMLPGISGAAVIGRLRGETATRRTPCLLLTASENPQEELDALEAGADSFVHKQEDLSVILARLAGILRSASTPAALALTQLTQRPRRVVLIGTPLGPLDSVGTVLLEEGCETVSVLPAQTTVSKCVNLSPDVLVFAAPVDEAMLSFCREFKTQPGLQNSRLVLLDTGAVGKGIAGRETVGQVAVAAIQAGADDYLGPASDQAIILARTKSQLRRKRMEDENRGLREHIMRQELETQAQRHLAEARSRHAEEMRIAYRLAEEKAHEAERARLELEQITEGIPQIVWTSDASGRIARFNRRWTDYTGLPHLAVSNGEWRRTIHREDVLRALGDWRQSFTGGLPYTSEYRLRSKTGDYRWFLVRAIPLADESGRIDRWFGTCTDVHDQKQSEEVLRRTEKLAATGRLAASIAHEINNPLESVTNLLYLIEQSTREMEDTHGYVTTAQKELDRVAQISKKTLAFYRESKQSAPVNLCELVAEVSDIYSVRLQRKEITLQVDEECSRRPQGLAGELRQVISNLLTNAIDASAPHSVIRVRIRSAQRWRGDSVAGVRISIGDSGHGIPYGLQAEIFKPFITTKGDLGTGLGLWLSHSIITRHGGSLQLRSSTGAKHGTVFSVFLPMTLTGPHSEADSMGSVLRTIGKELLGQRASQE